jgi:hypothetical protein
MMALMASESGAAQDTISLGARHSVLSRATIGNQIDCLFQTVICPNLLCVTAPPSRSAATVPCSSSRFQK